MRRIGSVRELVFHLANESRGVLAFRQAFVFRRRRKWRLEAVSSVTSFDPQAQLNRDLQQLVNSLGAEGPGSETQTVELAGDGASDALRDHAFPHGLWLPLSTRRGTPFAGLLLLKETPWSETVTPLGERVAATYAHAWEALAGRALDRRVVVPRRPLFLFVVLAITALGFLKAPLTVLAPVEVTGRDRVTVAAALNGVIEEVLVAPNSSVEEGSLLARYDDSELRNALEIANREAIVARTELEKLQSASFTDRTAARQLKVAEAELELALAERELAQVRLSRVDVHATRVGLAVFEDARDLIGKPVTVGERLMEIVDPNDLEFTIRLPVEDSIILREGAKVRVFLDSNPLSPMTAVLARRSYRATSHDDGSFGYTLTATADPKELAAARLGAQGTAQLYGDRHTFDALTAGLARRSGSERCPVPRKKIVPWPDCATTWRSRAARRC